MPLTITLKKVQKMIIGITGSRKFVDENCIEQAILTAKPTLIITGGAKGADTLAENIAKKHGIPCKKYLPKFKTDIDVKYHARWYLKRNKQIVDDCDLLLAFFAGTKSKGTQFTVDYANETNKPIKVFPKTNRLLTSFQLSLF